MLNRKDNKNFIFFIGLSGSPLNVAFNSRGKTSLQVSWKAPEESFQNGELTGYQVCFYTKDTVPECLVFASSKVLSLTLDNLKPSTKYFVIVSASTTVGLGEKSVEVSKITSGGNSVNMNSWHLFQKALVWTNQS